ncbi:hypothetical protein C8F04DRAFT_1257522 [Mycena alexandri]|uniref:DUF6532 domain-containing protein n=1 Tax=Mycena alexandri TaxID=1745969 RepID=A0AAD6T0N8_9AGAR|nr:hypothetical protein C8F04DRAFT_1322419 [Mycena alexandri]KAJ7035471.1 hypothetical protein C8F04DRAFT_1259015 [Mycena alexandri]KAJ7036977.1 hypothetical protein C8F04DRAFT_1257522 [Mycena alexandri]
MAPKPTRVPDSSDDEQEAGPARPKEKPPRRSGDDLSGNITLLSRTRTERERAPSAKQNLNNKENLESMELKAAKLQQAIEKTKRQLKKDQRDRSSAPAPKDDDLESEEVSDGENDISFHSSIKSLPPLPLGPPRPAVVAHKVKKIKGPPQTSSRAFLALPEQPSESPSADMDLDVPDSPLTNGGSMAFDDADAGHSPDRDHDGNQLETHRSSSPSPSSGRGRPVQSSTSSRKRPQQSSPPPPPPPKRVRQEPQFAEGYTSGGKPKAADYEPVVRALLLRAMLEYTVRILTKNPFPDVGLQVLWAKECFRSACRAAHEHFSITDRMMKLIQKRGSHIRSQIVTACRNLFASHYNFNRTSTSTAATKANRDLSTALCEDAAFHYKDVKTCTGFAENAIFVDIRRAVVFKNKKALGAIFASHFNPYPLPTAALEFIAVHHCAKEWSTGQFIGAEFQEKDVIDDYNTHLSDLQRWADLNEDVVLKLRGKWYTRASRTLGLAARPTGQSHISLNREELLRQELAGRTGETDSENEGENEQ